MCPANCLQVIYCPADAPPNACFQESAAQVGTIAPPITGPTPTSVPGQADLLQADNGPLTDATYLTRGYVPFAGPVTVLADPCVFSLLPVG